MLSDEAFLEYIRKQVESFTVGVSEKMLENENFHHLNAQERIISDPSKNQTEKENGVDHVPFTAHFTQGIVEDMANISLK